ncbi:MAG TPA: DNA polymerase [Aquabacterium sp.]|nr:DNA polymerase [Aquabacterium sp.]
MPRILHVDTETFSTIDIKCGVYRYAEGAEILMVSYAFDDEPVKLWDITMGEPPRELLDALRDPQVVKYAHNAPFERAVFRQAWDIDCPPEQWRCTAVMAASLSLPRSLAEVAKVLNFPADKQKMSVGKALIRYFCVPCKPTKTNGGRTRNLPEHDQAKWELFKQYCIQDTEVEREIHKKLAKYPMLEREWRLWEIDQHINDRGLQVDTQLVSQAMRIDKLVRESLIREASEITGLSNPNAVAQLRKWLATEAELETEDLTKKTVATLLGSDMTPEARRILEIRQQLGKTSVAKYAALDRYVCSDGRIRGIFLFYGAARTGRWSGSGFQPQNLTKASIDDVDDLTVMRDLVKAGDLQALEVLYGNVSQCLSDLIRTAIIAPAGKKLVVADLSAIEARVLAWFAKERWRLEVFRTHGKIYEASASEMFKVSMDLIKKGNPEYALRQKGKIAELALGYLGGTGALIAMGALDMGLAEDELPEIVRLWRAASPNVMSAGYQLGDDAMTVVRERIVIKRDMYALAIVGPFLVMRLPSGRRLHYYQPRIDVDPETGRESVTYMGINQYTRKWERISAWAGKWLENWDQAVAREFVAEALHRLQARLEVSQSHKCLVPIGHVHDEIICEADEDDDTAEETLVKALTDEIEWATGLPLAAAGYETPFYRKD